MVHAGWNRWMKMTGIQCYRSASGDDTWTGGGRDYKDTR